MSEHDAYASLRPPRPTPADELCTCPADTPVKLMSTRGIGFNPIHCLDCNREVPPERLRISPELTDAIASWLRTYGAIDALELESRAYEQWAREQLLDAASPPNVEGLALARRLNELSRCYFWYWQPEADDGWLPPSSCPVCGGPLARYDRGIFPQLLCERDGVVLAGAEGDAAPRCYRLLPKP